MLHDAWGAQTVAAAETISVPEAVGRVLAEPVWAKVSSPHFHAAAMDGIAVAAQNTYGAREGRPKTLTVGRDAFFVNTGNMLPTGTDAVIMIEHVRIMDELQLQIETPAFPWQHVRKMGEDIVATELLFPRNHVVSPYCVGALLSGGVLSVSVKAKPSLYILPTGSELADWRTQPLESLQPGQVIETNSYVLKALAEACGAVCQKHEKLADDAEVIGRALQSALQSGNDIILILGGSSAGSEDHARRVIEAHGEVLVHGVTMMPGKPTIIGRVGGKPVFGIPGYQVSAIMAFEQFVRPLICNMLGQPETRRPEISVYPTRKIPSKLGLEEFIRVKLGRVGDRVVAAPLPRGAGSITTITEADGIIRIPNDSEGLNTTEPVAAELLRPISAVENTLVVVGSHDNTLEVLADEIKAHHSGLSLSSSHVGSMGGLMALKKGVCHLAGAHLLDTADGTYNRSYIRKYLPDLKVRRVQLVFRDQGLIIRPENPKNIGGIEDLGRPAVRFVNRQGGSGTRILLDYRLQQLGLDPAEINGYADEAYTHMEVAAAVLSGRADAGLGIYAAAKALQLNFIPVVTEQYDLIIAETFFDTPNIRILLETIRSDTFQQRVMALGGYSVEKTGEILDI